MLTLLLTGHTDLLLVTSIVLPLGFHTSPPAPMSRYHTHRIVICQLHHPSSTRVPCQAPSPSMCHMKRCLPVSHVKSISTTLCCSEPFTHPFVMPGSTPCASNRKSSPCFPSKIPLPLLLTHAPVSLDTPFPCDTLDLFLLPFSHLPHSVPTSCWAPPHTSMLSTNVSRRALLSTHMSYVALCLARCHRETFSACM